MTTYAVTGGTGHLGPMVIEHLLARGVAPGDVVAPVRSPSRAAALADRGVQVREGDYDRPDTLDPALADVDRLLLVSGSEVGQRIRQHGAVVDAARRAGVSRILYTSVLRAPESTLVLAPEHAATEELITDSDLPHTMLRNTFYTEVYLDQLPTWLELGTIHHAAGQGRIAAAPRADLAEAAAVALLEDTDDRVVHELAGPGFTYDELAAAITEVTGTTVVARELSPDELIATLTDAGVDGGTAEFLAALDRNVADGELDAPTTDLERLLGRAPTTLVETLRDTHRATEG